MPLAAKMDAPAEAPKKERNMFHLSSREVPPGGLTYKIHELAETAPRESWVGPFNSTYDLANEVRKRCKANGLPAPTEAEIEDQLCQRLPPGYCRDQNNQGTQHPGAMSLGLMDVIKGTMALIGWFRHGSVDVTEIQRRTAVCNQCPENRQISGCQGCAGNPLRTLINKIVVSPLPSDAVLGACSICSCSLKSKVRMRLEDLPPLTEQQRARLPEKCWIIAPTSARDADPRT